MHRTDLKVTQGEPPDYTPIALVFLVAVGIFGIVHAVLGDGRNLFDYALAILLWLGACLLVVAAVTHAFRATRAMADFIRARKAK
jgi:hypothetical protein